MNQNIFLNGLVNSSLTIKNHQNSGLMEVRLVRFYRLDPEVRTLEPNVGQFDDGRLKLVSEPCSARLTMLTNINASGLASRRRRCDISVTVLDFLHRWLTKWKCTKSLHWLALRFIGDEPQLPRTNNEALNEPGVGSLTNAVTPPAPPTPSLCLFGPKLNILTQKRSSKTVFASEEGGARLHREIRRDKKTMRSIVYVSSDERWHFKGRRQQEELRGSISDINNLLTWSINTNGSQ